MPDRELTPAAGNRSLITRYIAMATGILVLVWLSIENDSLFLLIIISALTTTLGMIVLLSRSSRLVLARWYTYLLVGAVTGFLIIPVALMLVLVRIGLHNHPQPDFTPEQVQALLRLTPASILAGFLTGLGIHLWKKYQLKRHP
jgi:hypothetical protein